MATNSHLFNRPRMVIENDSNIKKMITVTFEFVDLWGNKDYETFTIIYHTPDERDSKLSDIIEKYEKRGIELYETMRY